MGNVGAEVFLHYSQFFNKGDFVIGGFECICTDAPLKINEKSYAELPLINFLHLIIC